jgi:L-rhamnose-H+ transport protein
MGVFYGIILAVSAGLINGLFALPMKAAKKWSWENSWLPFTLLALVVFPWLTAAGTVPNFCTAYQNVGAVDILIAIVWGMAVYTGSLIFGVSLSYIGTSLAFTLLVGTMNIVGVFLPILVFNPEVLGKAGGKWIMAGKLKERAQGGENTSGIGDKVKRSAAVGMLMAILGGALSGLLSLGLNMGWAKAISKAAVDFGGANPSNATNAILAFVLLGGSIPNIIYCIYLLSKNKTWQRYSLAATAPYWLVILLMGIMYSGSVALWGTSTSPAMFGKLGPSVGWALFIGMIVIGSSIGGFATGEWKNAGGKPVRIMLSGLSIIILSMILIAYGNFLLTAA